MENKELKTKLENFKKKNITLHEIILGGAAKIFSTGFFKNSDTNWINLNDVDKISWKQLLLKFAWVITMVIMTYT